MGRQMRRQASGKAKPPNPAAENANPGTAKTQDCRPTNDPTPTRRRRRSRYKLSDLLRQMKGPYPHRDVNRCAPVGREVI
jgi:hypothetical protein